MVHLGNFHGKLVGLGEKILACSFIFCIFAKSPWHVELHFSFKVDVHKLLGKQGCMGGLGLNVVNSLG